MELKAEITEKEFQQTVVDVARYAGWLVYHTHDSRHSEPGFPDLVLSKGTTVMFWELKSEKGKVTEHQWRWLKSIAQASTVPTDPHAGLPGMPKVIVRVMRPSDWPEIERLLGVRREQ